MEEVLGEIECTKTSSLRTKDRTTEGHTLTGENARMILASKLLIHTVEVTNLAATNANVTCRNILIRTDAAPELEHECLAETHDLSIRLANRIKVRTTLSATHRERGQCVLKRLLKAEELQHGRSHCLVETKTTLIRANS